MSTYSCIDKPRSGSSCIVVTRKDKGVGSSKFAGVLYVVSRKTSISDDTMTKIISRHKEKRREEIIKALARN